MEKEELRKEFNKRVAYIQKTVPPDDIYIFAEQTFMAAMYFLQTVSDYKDIETLCKDDEIFEKWAQNIAVFYNAQVADLEMTIDLKMDELDE